MPNQAVTINATFKASVEGNIESVKIGDMPEYIAIPSNESKNINVPLLKQTNTAELFQVLM